MQLTSEAFYRAREFLLEHARPLERALFLRDFEDGSAHDVLDALSAFRNQDGGFGHGLEPDLALPASSVLATSHALHILHAVGAPTEHELVAGAVDWLVAAHDPDLCAWRSVPSGCVSVSRPRGACAQSTMRTTEGVSSSHSARMPSLAASGSRTCATHSLRNC